ncbi:MAG: RNA polymerase sigma factor [Gemmatimonadales bacterium]
MTERPDQSKTHDSMRRVIVQHGARLARAAWGYVDQAHDHEDLMQEILLAVWRALPHFRGAASEKTFVLRIAHNRGVTFAARRRRFAPIADAEDQPDPAPSAEERLIGDQRRERLLAAVRKLNDSHRQAIMLHLEGLSTREIADVQGISESNASVRLTRARSALRAFLDGVNV